jgi:predicted restriction endonuclease
MHKRYRLTEFALLISEHEAEIKKRTNAAGRLRHVDLAVIFARSSSPLAKKYTYVFGGIPTTEADQYRWALKQTELVDPPAAIVLRSRKEYPCIDIQHSHHLMKSDSKRNPSRSDNYKDYEQLTNFKITSGRVTNITIDWELLAAFVSAYRRDGIAPIATRQKRETAAPQDLLDAEKRLEAEGAFNPQSSKDAREWDAILAVLRRGQAVFRSALMNAYSGTCAVTGCKVPGALEAAHIISYRGAHTNRVSNGVLLRADIHALFDAGLITISGSDYTLSIDATLTGSEYQQYHGRAIALPAAQALRPSRDALTQRNRDFGLTE